MLEEVPKGQARSQLVPVNCETCMELDDYIDKHEKDIYELKGLESLRREEEARMAERFEQIMTNQKQMSDRLEEQSKQISEVRDIALKNNHDLNNGIKSQIGLIRRAVVKNTKDIAQNGEEIATHEAGTPSTEETENLVYRVLDKYMDEHSSKRKRSVEIGIGVIVGIITLSETGVFDWFFSLFGG